MAVYSVKVYDWSPYTYFTSSPGTSFTLTGDVTQTIDVDITDNETGVDGLTLDDNVANSQETATADIFDSAGTVFGLDIHADAGWTLYDPIDDVTFEVVLMSGGKGQTSVSYTLSEYPLVEGRTYEVVAFDNQPNAKEADSPVFTYGDYVCFSADARVQTKDGWTRVETLKAGDLVATRDKGFRPLLWTGQRKVFVRKDDPPVRICAGAFGSQTDIVVSPLHRLLVAGPETGLLFGETEVLARARDLVGRPGIEAVTDMTSVTYVHLLFDTHELVNCDGMWFESLFFGDVAQMRLFRWECATIKRVLRKNSAEEMRLARYGLRKYEARLLANPGNYTTPSASLCEAPQKRAA